MVGWRGSESGNCRADMRMKLIPLGFQRINLWIFIHLTVVPRELPINMFVIIPGFMGLKRVFSGNLVFMARGSLELKIKVGLLGLLSQLKRESRLPSMVTVGRSGIFCILTIWLRLTNWHSQTDWQCVGRFLTYVEAENLRF